MELETYRLLQVGLTLAECDEVSAERAEDLLDIHALMGSKREA